MTVMLVEDDHLLAETLKHTLEQAGHHVLHLGDGINARERLTQKDHVINLVLLDLNLPGCSGLDVLAALRRHDRDTPVLILTARGAIEDRVKGLDLGADDYLAKPFSLDELEARIRALLRRRTLEIGGLSLNPLNQQLYLNGKSLALPPREQRLLVYLMRHAGQPVDKTQLTEQAFQGHTMGDNAIEVYVHRLRKHLCDSKVTLRTVRGLGYVLETE
ncbi:response regulator transcription factor [Halomonas halocynthiae]|uniref:response regulator transcription factor n=1 Tax=Halomonas halocynthiae TaxID=176290 RepID=UPI000418FA75|nr:response regulator transcription factor [Halomonas halocynthiae]